jgi:two-component sensor histidine kinase
VPVATAVLLIRHGNSVTEDSMDAIRDQPTDNLLSDGVAVLEGLRLGQVGVWRWRINTDVLEWSPNLEAVHDLPAGSFDGTLASFQGDLHPDDAAAVWESIQQCVATGAPYRAVYRTRPREGRPPLWIETTGGVVTGPDGNRYLTGICLDVSDRVQSENELKRRLRQQQAIESCGSFALAESNFQATLQRVVETAADVLDVPLTKVLQLSNTADQLLLRAGVGWKDGLIGVAMVGIEAESQAGYTLMCGEPVIVRDLRSETRFSGPPLLIEHKVRSGMSVVIPGSEARPFGVLGIHTPELRKFDDADRDFLLSLANIIANSARHHAAEAQRSLLVREMAHRAGNLLQLVSSVANQTFAEGSDPATARRSFNQRLGSLSRANHLVAQGGWSSTRFINLVRETLEPFRERLLLQGRDILLPPDLCFDFSLVLHELATNSAKYGTLGADDGEVVLSWVLESRKADIGSFAEPTAEEPVPATEAAPEDTPAVEAEPGEVFHFTWSDTAPVPEEAAVGSGFGSRLLTALIERKWGGTMRIETDGGYRFSSQIPLPR